MTARIVLACAAGMSTSLLESKMKKAAKDQHLDVTIDALPVAEALDLAGEGRPDVVLLGPQVSYMRDEFVGAFAASGAEPAVPVQVIDMTDYGTMNGSAVLQAALRLVGGGGEW